MKQPLFRIFLLNSMIGLSQLCFGQTGYMLTSVGDTIRGTIKITNGDKGYRAFFRESNSFEELSPMAAKGFGDFTSGRHFLTRNIDGEEVFVRYLVSGSIQLYYVDGPQERFFISNDKEFAELKSTFKYVNNAQQEVREYLSVLNYFLSTDLTFKSRIENTTLTKGSLSELLATFNQSNGGRGENLFSAEQITKNEFESSSFGYIVKADGDTISGFLIKEGDYAMELGCSFSPSGFNYENYRSGQILGFGNLETNQHYRNVEIDNQQTFLKVLVDGKISLLYSVKNSGTFYIKKSNQISQLIEEMVTNAVDGREYKLKKFINVLSYFMADEPSVSADIQKAQLTKPSLANIVMKYNSIDGVIPVDFYHDEVSKKKDQSDKIHLYVYGVLNSLSEYNSTKFKSFISPGFGLEFETPGLGKETYFLIDLNFGSTEVESTLLSTSVDLAGTKAKFTNTSLNFGTAIVSEKNVKVKGAVGLAFMSNSIDMDVNMQDLGFYEKFVGYKISVNTLIGNRFSILGSINNYSRQEIGGVNPEKTKVTIAQIGIAFKVI